MSLGSHITELRKKHQGDMPWAEKDLAGWYRCWPGLPGLRFVTILKAS